MDRLIEAIEDKQNPSVVGLDPTEALVPKQVVASFAEEIAEQVEDPTEAPAAQLSVAFFEFNRAIIDAVADIVPAVKPQIAMYEALGPAGIDAYSMTCEYAKQQGLYVLGDVKRGDIGSTAAAYAHHLSGVNAGEHAFDPWHEDAVTVNPYLGTDGITPFVEAATGADKDIFVLVRTSNPSSSELQELELASGERVARRCGRACRTRSSWSPVTARRAVPPKAWPACSTKTAWARSSIRRVASSEPGRSPANTANP